MIKLSCGYLGSSYQDGKTPPTMGLFLSMFCLLHKAQVRKVFHIFLEIGLSILYLLYKALLGEGFQSFSAKGLPLDVPLNEVFSGLYSLVTLGQKK